MKKITPFLILVPLLVVSIYIYYVQFQNRKIKQGGTNDIIQNEKSASPIPTTSTISSNKTQEINLTISSPESGIVLDATVVTVSGSTQANASIVINDEEIVANKDGSFQSSVSLDEGDNYISIVAYNDFGNIAEREIIVTRVITGL